LGAVNFLPYLLAAGSRFVNRDNRAGFFGHGCLAACRGRIFGTNRLYHDRCTSSKRMRFILHKTPALKVKGTRQEWHLLNAKHLI
jgi:hypothetical protein